MDRKYIDENAIGMKFLRNELNDEELEQFEIYMLENPDIIDELELDEVFSSELDFHEEAHNSGTPLSKGGMRKSFWKSTHYHSAVSFLVGAVLVGSWASLRPIDSPVIQDVYLERESLRSSKAVPPAIVSLGSGSFRAFSRNQFVLVVDTLSNASNDYKIEIFEEKSNRISFSQDLLRSNNRGQLVLVLPTSDFPPNEYRVNAWINDVKSPLNMTKFVVEVIED